MDATDRLLDRQTGLRRRLRVLRERQVAGIELDALWWQTARDFNEPLQRERRMVREIVPDEEWSLVEVGGEASGIEIESHDVRCPDFSGAPASA